MRNKLKFFRVEFFACSFTVTIIFPSFFHFVEIMDVNTPKSINKKRNADEMETNEPNELQTVKIQKSESAERKYRRKKKNLPNKFQSAELNGSVNLTGHGQDVRLSSFTSVGYG